MYPLFNTKNILFNLIFLFFVQNIIAQNNNKISEIGVPVRLTVLTIETEMNKKLKDTVFRDDKFKSDYGIFDVTARKIAPIKIKGENKENKINIESTFRLIIKGTLETNFIGIPISMPIDQQIAMKVWLSSIFSLEKNWQLLTKTTLEKHEWLEEPVLDLGLMKLPLTKIADAMLEQNRESFAKQLDDQMKPHLSWKKPITQAWENLQTPLPISEWEKDTVWASMQAENIAMTALTCQRDTFFTWIKIPVKATGTIKNKPKNNTKILPDFTLLTEKPAFGELKIKTLIDKNLAEQKMQKIFGEQEFEFKKYKSKVEKITIYNAKNNLWGVELLMKGSINGKMFVEAIPINKKGKIEIQKLTYRIDGESDFPAFAEWLFKGKIKKQIKKAIEEPLNQQIEAMKKEIEKKLENYLVPPYAKVQGKLKQFDWNNFILTEKSIEADLNIKGEWNVEMIGF
ncbi:MAG: DUF4403 family protein [Bacteroidetes bacterium]|nr:MAG: DUF4403 family protein [Bacteroidota bacterium]TAG92945.1 MAG: DUF4403 family protein [Bacteroidota bacterium]